MKMKIKTVLLAIPLMLFSLPLLAGTRLNLLERLKASLGGYAV